MPWAPINRILHNTRKHDLHFYIPRNLFFLYSRISSYKQINLARSVSYGIGKDGMSATRTICIHRNGSDTIVDLELKRTHFKTFILSNKT